MKKSDVLAYIEETYGHRPEYLWARTPDSGVFRHSGNRKWYAAVLVVPRDKLKLPGDGPIDVLNVKCEPEWGHLLRQQPGVLPAYHMNKEHWVTLLLDGTVGRELICKVIDASYVLTKSPPSSKPTVT